MSKREKSKAVEFPLAFHQVVKRVAEYKPFGKEAMASIIQHCVLSKFEEWRRIGVLPETCKFHMATASEPKQERD